MITVSIVTYKTNLGELSKCLQSLISSLVSQIYIVDNSNERYIADFCQQYPNVIYIGSENVGYGAGHNQALRQVLNSGGKYHLILNSDVYFEPSVLEFLAAYMDAHADVAQVQPNVVYPDGEQQYTCRLLPTPANLIFRRFLPKRMVEKMNIRYQLKFDDHKKEMNVPYHQGSFMFFRLECFKKVGLFDERFFMYPEDIDLKSATKLFSVLLASKRPLITELADKLRLKYPLLPTISPCPTMRLEAIRSIIPISCRRYPKSV